VLVVGLTGGIGSGKTAVSDGFARLGAPIIDTDVLARTLVTPGQPALEEIVAAFGPRCLNADGSLDRGYVRQRVFADPERRKRLEAILHPRIRAAVRDGLATLSAPYCIVVIPLLIETGMTDLVHRVLVVDVTETTQVQRVVARDGITGQQARDVLAAQASRRQRLAQADDVLDNSGNLADLKARIEQLHQGYLKLAGGKFSD
jgi:dephospho-CoA kinase